MNRKWPWIVLGVWLVLAVAASWFGWLQSVPVALLFAGGFVLPAAVFAACYSISIGFRRFVLSRNLRWLTLLQASRATGIIFFVEYFRGRLPALFAWPTGSSDMLIGVTAPVVAFVLLSRKAAPGRTFVLWHVLGICGLLLSTSMGILTSPGPFGVHAGNGISQAMSSFPLSLVLTFLGPVILILHLMTLSIVLARTREDRVNASRDWRPRASETQGHSEMPLEPAPRTHGH